MTQSSLMAPQPKDRKIRKGKLLYPRPPKDILKPEEGKKVLRQIVGNFMSRYNVYEIRKLWLLRHYHPRFVQLKGDVDLYVYSHMKYLIVPNRKYVETIVLTARKEDWIIDQVFMYVDISQDKTRVVEYVWDFIEWNHIIQNKHFCFEDRVEFDSDVNDLYGVKAVDRPGFEIYSRQACDVLAQQDLDDC